MTTHVSTAGGAQRTVLVRDFSELLRYGPCWQRLWDQQDSAGVFSHLSWITAFWKAYGSQRTLFTPVVFRGDRVIGILPLSIDRQGTLQFICDPRSDYNDLLCEQGEERLVLEHALREVLEAKDAWARFRLRCVPEHAKLLHAIEELPADLRRLFVFVGSEDCPAVVVTPSSHDLLADIVAKKSLNRHEKKLARFGNLEFNHLEDRQGIIPLMDEFFCQHVSRWALAGHRSLFCDAEARAFYHALVENFDPAGMLRFGVLSAGTVPVAFHFGFECRSRLIWYKPSYHLNFMECGPGEVLLKRLFEYQRRNAILELDFTGGGEGFKRRFANVTRQNREFSVMPHPGGRWLLRMKQGIKSFVEKVPAPLTSPLKAWATSLRKLRGALAANFRSLIRRRASLRSVNVHVFELDLDRAKAPRAASDDFAVDLTPVDLKQFGSLAAEFPGYVTQDRLAAAVERRKRGDLMAIARMGDKIAHFAWLRIDQLVVPIGELGVAVPLSSSARVRTIFDCWTPPAARGQGFYPKTLAQIASLVSHHGEPLLIYCNEDNAPSVRGILKAGFKVRYIVSGKEFKDTASGAKRPTQPLASGQNDEEPR